MEETQPQPSPDPPPPSQPPPPQNAAGSRLLTIGILMAAVAVGAVLIKQDRAKDKDTTVATKAGDEKSNVKIGGMAPKLVLKDLNGKTVDLAQLKGKVVLVDFWATWCDPCTVLIPWFIDFRNRYGSQGLEVVGVAMDEEGLEAVKPYAEKAKMNYVILLGNEDTAQAWGGIFGLPTSFIIDRQGNIQHRHVGLVGRDVFEKEIRGLL
jgi:peroxiredoxin